MNKLIIVLFLISCNNSRENVKHFVSDNKYLPHDSLTKENKFLEKADQEYKSKKFDKALNLFDSLLLMDSTQANYYFKRAYCKSMMFDDTGAIKDYKKSLYYNYNKKGSVYLNLGSLYYLAFHKFDSAIYFYNECLKLDPNNQKAILGKEDAIKSMDELR